MIDKLTEQEWQTNEAIARRLNVVIEAVEALRRQFEQHIAVEDGAMPVEARGIPLTVDDILAVRRALSANRKVWAVTANRKEDGIWVFRVAVRNPTPEDDMAIISAHHDWLEAHPDKEFFDVSIDASWGDEDEDVLGMGGQAADGVSGNVGGWDKEDMAMLERFAALEHEQWAHWTRYMLDNMTPENAARWRRQIETPYEALTEKEKDSDREWARRVMDVWRQPCPTCGQVPEGQGGEYPCPTCGLPTVHDERPDPEDARYAAILALRAERDAAQARVAELEADAALGALVRRMLCGAMLTRYASGRWSARRDVVGWPHTGDTPEEALRAALGEEATDAH